MRKRPLEVLAAGYLLGAVCAFLHLARFGVPSAVIITAILMRFMKREHPCADALFFLCVFVAGSVRTAAWEHSYLMSAPGPVGAKEIVAVEGRIEEVLDRDDEIRLIIRDAAVRRVGEDGDLVHRGGRWYVYLKSDVEIACSRVEALIDSPEKLLPGYRLSLTGTVMLPEGARNDGEFDYETFCRAHEIRGSVFPKYVKVTDARASRVPAFFLGLRRTAMRALSFASEEDFGLLAAVLIGNRSFVSEHEYEDFTEAGAGHILSISGIHLSILCYGFFCLLRRLRVPIAVRTLLPVGLVWFYAFFAGLPVSALRASVMFTIMMGGEFLGRQYDIRSGMAAALLILLAARPGYLLLTGMKYSFAALFGICFVVPAVETCLGDHLQADARRAFAGYIGVFLATLPLQCLYNFEFSPFSILFNGVLIPCMGLLLGSGFGGIAAGAMAAAHAASAVEMTGGSSGTPDWAEYAAKLIFRIPHLILFLYRIVSSLPSVLPAGRILTGKPTVPGLIFFALSAILILLLSYRKEKSRYLVLLLILPLFLLHPDPADTRIDVIDVGQGNCAVIRMRGGSNVVIDCGSTDRRQLGEYTMIPYLRANRIASIDLAVVSHMDADHMDGFRQLIASQIPVRRFALTDRAEASEETEEFEALARRAGARILHAGAGDVLMQTGKGEKGDRDQKDERNQKDDRNQKDLCSLVVLAPEHGAVRGEENEYSLVLCYREGGFSMLFPGDLSESGEERMIRNSETGTGEKRGYEGAPETPSLSDLPKGGILLAGHHGSMYSSGEALLNSIRPALTIFSAGAGNSYGHPHEQALERAARAGSQSAVTMETGQVSITVKNGKFTVKFLKGGLRNAER